MFAFDPVRVPEGLVLQPEYGSNAWDASGTFTPGIVKECAGAAHACKFYLFFGGVENQTSAHTPMQATTAVPPLSRRSAYTA